MDHNSHSCFILAVIVFIVLLVLCGLVIYYNTIDSSSVKVYETNIVSLERDTYIHGSFVLGFGTINYHSIYYAYEEIEKDSFVLRSFESNRLNYDVIIIRETDEISPRFRTTYTVTCWEDGWFYDCDNHMDGPKMMYEVFVPKGTIRKEFRG